jgi:DNA-directed RNA polymerase subunit beta'
VTGTVSFGKDTKGKQRLIITDFDGAAHEYLIPKDKHITVHDGQVVNRAKCRGSPADDILGLQGMEALAATSSTGAGRLPAAGVKINDKHIEVIVRQMLRRVSIVHPGRVASSPASRSSVPKSSTRTTASRQGKKPAVYSTCSSASPRRRCRPIRSSPRPPSRRLRAC